MNAVWRSEACLKRNEKRSEKRRLRQTQKIQTEWIDFGNHRIDLVATTVLYFHSCCLTNTVMSSRAAPPLPKINTNLCANTYGDYFYLFVFILLCFLFVFFVFDRIVWHIFNDVSCVVVVRFSPSIRTTATATNLIAFSTHKN